MLQIPWHALSRLFLYLAIVLIPFNALPYFREVLREMSNEGAFYPLVAGLLVWFLLLMEGARLQLPKHLSAKLLLLFAAWIVVSGLANVWDISSLETKGRTGVEKYIFQILLACFVMLVSLFVYGVAIRTEKFLVQFQRCAMWSFLIAGAYSLFEIAFLLGNDTATSILGLVNPFIFSAEVPEFYFGRLRSVSGEASWFGMYSSLVFPWLLAMAFSGRTLALAKWLLITYAILLIILTWSRTAYMITLIQIALFVLGVSWTRIAGGRWPLIFFVALFTVMIAASQFLLFQSEVVWDRNMENMADVFASLLQVDNSLNLSRYGSQATAYLMAMDNPVFGVGLGQYGFHMPAYVPDWALLSEEIQEWMNPGPDTAWAPALGIYARIAAELGFVGLAIWIALWGSLVVACYQRYRSNSAAGSSDMLGLALIVSVVGVLLTGFQADSFRFFGYWISMGMAWAYIDGPARGMSDQMGRA